MDGIVENTFINLVLETCMMLLLCSGRLNSNMNLLGQDMVKIEDLWGILFSFCCGASQKIFFRY